MSPLKKMVHGHISGSEERPKSLRDSFCETRACRNLFIYKAFRLHKDLASHKALPRVVAPLEPTRANSSTVRSSAQRQADFEAILFTWAGTHLPRN